MWERLKNEIRRQQSSFDRQIQDSIAEDMQRGGRIFCARGCRNCCTLTVNCGFSEALLVAESLTENQATALADYAARLRKLLPGAPDLKAYLKMQRQQLGDCPFLDLAGICGIYPARPFACRALLSTRPADWCGVDFGTLPAIEKQLYLASLDRTIVDFPTHYLAASRDIGQQLESEALLEMAKTCGFTLSGNLPYLVWLEKEYRLSEKIAQGKDLTIQLLAREGLDLPFVIMLGI
jgi:Fe-S-cluster containining protein